jgi:hypothetical protein
VNLIDGAPRSKVILRPDFSARIALLEAAYQRFDLPIQADSATGSRLAALRAFAIAPAPITEDTPILPLLGEALWLADIFERLSDEVRREDHCKRLRSPKTFDSVYVELVAASMVKMGGGQVELKDADVRAVVGGEAVSIACKRITSIKKLIPRCREARDQIIQHGLPGIGVIDISYLLAAKPNWSYADVERATRALLAPYVFQLRSHLIGRPLIRALLFMNQHYAVTLERDENGKGFYRGNTFHHFGKVDLTKTPEAEALMKCLEDALG